MSEDKGAFPQQARPLTEAERHPREAYTPANNRRPGRIQAVPALEAKTTRRGFFRKAAIVATGAVLAAAGAGAAEKYLEGSGDLRGKPPVPRTDKGQPLPPLTKPDLK